MADARARHVAEMNRLLAAIEKADSPHLARDYKKAYDRMAEELAEYDRYRHQSKGKR